MIPPGVAPGDPTNSHSVTFAAEWLPVILGLLMETTEPDFWMGTDTEKEQASEWADELIKIFMVGNE